MPVFPGKHPVTEDLLEALLRTALAEGTTLDERTLPRFAEALRARAERILADRLRTVEEEREALRADKRTTAEAHDRLLAHHHATLRRLAEALEAMPAGLPWRYRRVRAQIEHLVETLRKEAP